MFNRKGCRAGAAAFACPIFCTLATDFLITFGRRMMRWVLVGPRCLDGADILHAEFVKTARMPASCPFFAHSQLIF